jgi:hypothetical protein
MPYCDWDKHAGETKSYEIASIYYDTDDLRFYFDREESIGYRRKIRLRSYNTGHEARALFIEIKEKHKHFVHKKRINLKSMDLLKLDSPDIELPLGAVIQDLEDTAEAREIEYLHKRLHLYPVALIRYHRKAAIPKFEDDMRITLDTNITTGGHSLPVFDPSTEQPIIAPDCGVLEIKSNQSIPFWLQSILIRYDMAQCRYSKYCLGVDILFGRGAHKNFVPVCGEDPLFADESKDDSGDKGGSSGSGGDSEKSGDEEQPIDSAASDEPLSQVATVS